MIGILIRKEIISFVLHVWLQLVEREIMLVSSSQVQFASQAAEGSKYNQSEVVVKSH